MKTSLRLSYYGSMAALVVLFSIVVYLLGSFVYERAYSKGYCSALDAEVISGSTYCVKDREAIPVEGL
jgi:hypothetical protein